MLAAIQDEGTRGIISSAYRGLRRIGVRRPQRRYRGSFAFIGYTGPGRKSFVRGVSFHNLITKSLVARNERLKFS